MISSAESSWRPVTSSVPQGLVLFNIFISDLDEGIECTLSKFADVEMRRMVDTLEVCDAIQRDLCSLERWTGRILMRFNRGKCRVLHLERNKCMPSWWTTG